jgi:hypothetical protein
MIKHNVKKNRYERRHRMTCIYVNIASGRVLLFVYVLFVIERLFIDRRNHPDGNCIIIEKERIIMS